MLAQTTGYLRVWQIPFLVLLIAGWFAGGTWLLLWSARRHNYPRKLRGGQALVIIFLVAVTGGIVAGATWLLVKTVVAAMDGDPRLPALAAAALAPFLIAPFVIYAMLEERLLGAIRIAFVPVLLLGLWTLALGLAMGLPARAQHLAAVRAHLCKLNVAQIGMALGQYQQRYAVPAPDLQALVIDTSNFLNEERLRCPGNTKAVPGYLYVAVSLGPNADPNRILVCDRAENHPGGRNVMFTDAQQQWMPEGTFQDIVAQPVNEPFRSLETD